MIEYDFHAPRIGMYIKSLEIKNFRSIKQTIIYFTNGTNILTGPNNSGKSTIIDALRICLSQGKFNRDIWISKTDFHIDTTSLNEVIQPIELIIEYHADEKDIPTLLSLHSAEDDKYTLTFRAKLEIKNEKEKISYEYLGGAHGQIEKNYSESINNIYLDPLRDAERRLRPMKGNLLGKFFQGLVTEETKRKKLSRDMQEATQNLLYESKLI